MSSIFGVLDKRQRAESAAAMDEGSFSFEDRADLLNDLLEEDLTTFPLLICPPEVLANFLLFLEATTPVRLRPLCAAMRGAVDGNNGLWCSLIARDFADLGGVTKHYKGLRTLADASDDSRAFVRLEWDPLMICATPPLRYALLATAKARRQRWDACGHGHALGTGWAWFSAKVCRRMAAQTFLRWASLQHDKAKVYKIVEPYLGKLSGGPGVARGDVVDAAGGYRGDASVVEGASAAGGRSGEKEDVGVHFRRGRSDAITLSVEAATDIYETVQRWHNQQHRDMMRAHIKGSKDDGSGGEGQGASQSASVLFSATPTLDAAEAALSAAEAFAPELRATSETGPNEAASRRGAASRHIEEAQLRLALELSKSEADVNDSAGSCEDQVVAKDAAEKKKDSDSIQPQSKKPTSPAAQQEEPVGLVLRAEGVAPEMVVYLKEHCLAARVDALPDRFEASIESVVGKMMKSNMWVLLYESITEELTFRAKLAAEALCASHTCAMDDLLSTGISLSQERMCLPVWNRSSVAMLSLSKLRAASCDDKLRQARCDLVRQASLEWCEHEDLTTFLDSQLQPLQLEIDHFHGMHEVREGTHTPQIADVGRLMFRNFCLLDSRVFRPLCLASYALVHELHAVDDFDAQSRLVELLEGLHAMLVACDVADDQLSASKNTKETFEEFLLLPITTALERYTPWDIRGHSDNDGKRRSTRRDIYT